jgi:hypothetical protein
VESLIDSKVQNNLLKLCVVKQFEYILRYGIIPVSSVLMNDINQEAISSFTAITDSSEDVAREYLAVRLNLLQSSS